MRIKLPFQIIKQKTLSDLQSKVITLQAENENLKDQLIIELQERIRELESKIQAHEELFKGSNSVYPELVTSETNPRPQIRTLSEVTRLLEARSLVLKEKINAKD